MGSAPGWHDARFHGHISFTPSLTRRNRRHIPTTNHESMATLQPQNQRENRLMYESVDAVMPDLRCPGTNLGRPSELQARTPAAATFHRCSCITSAVRPKSCRCGVNRGPVHSSHKGLPFPSFPKIRKRLEDAARPFSDLGASTGNSCTVWQGREVPGGDPPGCN